MKKLWIALLAAALVWAMVPAVHAADNLAMSGSMRVIYKFVDVDDGSSFEQSSFNQRMRMGGTFTAAEGVTADFRFDISEGTWGDSYLWSRWGWASPKDGRPTINVDRAYLTVDKEMWKLWAGEKWHGHGQYLMWDAQSTGINLDIKLNPVTITLHYSKLDENGSVTDEDMYTGTSTTVTTTCGGTCVATSVAYPTSSEDSDFYGVVLKYAHDAFNLGAMFAAIQDNADTDDSPWGFGVFGDTKFGPVNLAGEFDFFGGDYGTMDYVGAHFMLDANMQALDNLLVGGMFWYAAATTDSNEVQATGVFVGGETFAPLDWRGPLYDFGYPLGSLAGGTGSSGGMAMDLGSANTGVIGGQLYADWTIIEPLVAYMHVGYATPNDDKNTQLDNAMVIGGSLDYRLAERASLTAGLLYTDFEWDTASAGADDVTRFLTRLQVNF